MLFPYSINEETRQVNIAEIFPATLINRARVHPLSFGDNSEFNRNILRSHTHLSQLVFPFYFQLSRKEIRVFRRTPKETFGWMRNIVISVTGTRSDNRVCVSVTISFPRTFFPRIFPKCILFSYKIIIVALADINLYASSKILELSASHQRLVNRESLNRD